MAPSSHRNVSIARGSTASANDLTAIVDGVGDARSFPPEVLLDATALNSTISQQYKEKFGGSTIVVNCPDNQKVAKGKTFTCDIQGRRRRSR